MSAMQFAQNTLSSCLIVLEEILICGFLKFYGNNILFSSMLPCLFFTLHIHVLVCLSNENADVLGCDIMNSQKFGVSLYGALLSETTSLGSGSVMLLS